MQTAFTRCGRLLLTALVAAGCSHSPCPAQDRYLATPLILTVKDPSGDSLCDADVSASMIREITPYEDCTYYWPGWELEDAGTTEIMVRADGTDYIGTVSLPINNVDECGNPLDRTVEVTVEPVP